MSYIHSVLSRPARISMDQGFICASGILHFNKIPIEDLDSLILDHSEITISIQSLRALACHGVSVLICNKNHKPIGIYSPFASHSHRLSKISLQINQSKPRIKNLWKQIVQQKIFNQGKCLVSVGKNDNVSVYAQNVRSGDSGNMEGVAAARYFPSLFGKDFIRHQSDFINSFLNYGYAVIRSSISRMIAVSGLEPFLGLFHHNEQNPWNLADDLIEPFRPVVDLLASQYCHIDSEAALEQEHRLKIVSLLASDVLFMGERLPVSFAIEKTVQSLIQCFKDKTKKLSLPVLLPLSLHCYE